VTNHLGRPITVIVELTRKDKESKEWPSEKIEAANWWSDPNFLWIAVHGGSVLRGIPMRRVLNITILIPQGAVIGIPDDNGLFHLKTPPSDGQGLVEEPPQKPSPKSPRQKRKRPPPPPQ
jgi:hypothetical protein